MPRADTQSVLARTHPTVTAHAGSLRTAANTPAAFRAALAFPVDYLEADVRFTPEHDAYLAHDPLAPSGQKNAMQLKELLELAAAHPTVCLNLDMKEYSGIRKMTDLVKLTGMAPRVLLTGIESATVRRVRDEADGLAYLLNARPRLWQRLTDAGAAALAREVRATGARGLNVHHRLITRRLVRALAAAGLEVSVWTVDAEREMRRLLSMPVDNITTNRIDALLALRNGRLR